MNAAVRRVALGATLALAAIATLLLQGDGAAPADADLMAVAAPVADHENGYVTLAAAAELLQWPEDEASGDRLIAMSRGVGWDDELAARVLAANEFALHAFARVARNPAFQSPAGSPAPRPPLAEALRLEHVLAIRAIAAARRGEAEPALEDSLLAMRTARRIGANPNGALLYAEASFAAGEIGLRALEAVSQRIPLGAERSLALSRELSALRPSAADWRSALAAEYRIERALLVASTGDRELLETRAASAPAERIVRWLPDRYALQPNNSLAALAAEVRVQQARADEPCSPPPDVRPLGLLELLRPNPLGRRALAEMSERGRVETSRCAQIARIELMRAGVAVRAFEADRGVLPPSLEALVPAYQDAAPVDPFSGGVLRFDRAQRVIYSVGSDGVDDGGRERPDAEQPREPRFVVPAVAPR
ncbi:MAG TPA: hypothetical protein VII78_05230 [Myxococcota bacterium]|jgi:phage FluMu protein gp41